MELVHPYISPLQETINNRSTSPFVLVFPLVSQTPVVYLCNRALCFFQTLPQDIVHHRGRHTREPETETAERATEPGETFCLT